jgi:hypothetical protein
VVPTDDGKMADTQPTLLLDAGLEPLGGLLDLDPVAVSQPVFALPASTGLPTTPPSPPVDTGAVASSPRIADASGPTQEDASPSLSESLWPPILLTGTDEARRSDPDVPSLPSSGYMTAPNPGGYVTQIKVQEVDFIDDTVALPGGGNGPHTKVLADPGRTQYPSENGQPEWRDHNLDGQIVDSWDEWAVPTAIVRNTKPVVSAKFVVQQLGSAPNPAPPKTLKIRGVWQGSGLLSNRLFPNPS